MDLGKVNVTVLGILITLLEVARASSEQYVTNNLTADDQNCTCGSHQDDHHSRWEEYGNIFLFSMMILLASLLKVAFHHLPVLAHNIPESCLLIIIGIITGVIVHFAYDLDGNQFPSFTQGLFYNVLLPPIILDAAYSIYDEDFFRNLYAILMFAVVGTIFNVFLIGLSLYVIYSCFLKDSIPDLDVIQCLIFSSVISAVDPVAVLAIFDEIGVNMVLYFLVFGESLLNDGVTIVIYQAMIGLNKMETIPVEHYFLVLGNFFIVCFGGLLIGCLIGVLTSLIFRLTSRARVMEPLIMVTMAYLSFVSAEIFHWSGIISLVGCGIMQKRYAFINASKKTYTTVKYAVKTFSSTSDCIIFIFLGKVAAYRFRELDFDPAFIAFTLVLISIVRFAGVFLLSSFINERRLVPISWSEQFIVAYGGLRGAVGFSLIYILDDKNPLKKIFLTTTLVVVFFTVFVQGSTIKLLVKKLDIALKNEKSQKRFIISDVNRKVAEHLMQGLESITGNLTISSYLTIVESFDNRFVKRLLLSKNANDRMALRLQKITLDEHFARLYGPAVLIAQDQVAYLKELKLSQCNCRPFQVPLPPVAPPDDEDDTKLRRRLHLPPTVAVSEETCRASLNLAFRESPYERYRNRISRGDGDWLRQLETRSRQAKDIEQRLLETLSEEENAVPPSPVFRRRSRSSGVPPKEMRKRYLEAKNKFKSMQQP